MSFLDDSSATLEEALAFIDAHASSEGSSGSTVQRKPRKSPKPGYWERLKAESDCLREQTTELEETLTQLQAKAAKPVNGERYVLTDRIARRTPAHVELELQRRQEAESTNQNLKGLIARNLKTFEALTTLSIQAADSSSSVLSALVNRANALEFSAMAILSRAGLLESESFLHHTRRGLDPELGSVVETVSSVPLTINTQQTDVALWRRFVVDAEVSSIHPKYIKLAVGGLVKSHSSTFAFGGERFKLTTNMLLRRRSDARTAVYVWTASTVVPNTGFEFVEEGLITARDPKTAMAQRPALFQYWYRIHTEVCEEAHESLAAIDLELLRESAMRLRSHLSMSYIQSLENSLVSGNTSVVPICGSQNLL